MGNLDDLNSEEQAMMEQMEQDTAPISDEEIAQGQSDVADPPADVPSPTPAAPAEPAQPLADAPAPEAIKPPEGYVPHAALHQERERRKALEQELAALRAPQQQAPIPQGQQQPPADMPDPIIDPQGFRQWQQEQFAAQNQWRQQQETQRQEQAAYQAKMQAAQQYEAQFAAANPDYAAAVKHLHEHRVAELKSYGYPDAQIAGMIRAEANAIMDQGLSMGVNPASLLYNAAKHRGYAATPTPAPAQNAGAQMQAKAQAAAQTGTLSTAGGPAVVGEHTVESLSRMSEDQLAKLDPAVVRKVLGG